MNSQRCSLAFTRIDLLLVLGMLAVLVVVKVSALAASKGPGQSAVCQNNLRQLGVSVLMYSAENGGYFPARTSNPFWAEKLRRYYRALNFLRCPSDGPNPRTYGQNPDYPGDVAPRSYLYNGWDDYFLEKYSMYDWGVLVRIASSNSIPEKYLQEPSATITIGEKKTDVAHFYMDLAEPPLGNDIDSVEHGRHFRSGAQTGRGGSNFAFADGSVRFLNYGGCLTPTNLWAVTPLWRYGPYGPD